MLQKNEIAVGDLVLRGSLMFLVVEIGSEYQQGFALCRELKKNPRDVWIMQSLLCPLEVDRRDAPYP